MISFATINDLFRPIKRWSICLLKSLFLFVFLAIITNTFAQQSVALFEAKNDSIAYVQVQTEIQSILRNRPGDNTSFDSLLQIQATLRSKIIGYKVVYNSNKTFTPLEDITQRKVSPLMVSRLSISGEEVKKLSSTVFHCKNLTELELVNTSLKRLPSKLSKLQKLKTIYVFNNSPTRKLKLGKNKTTRELIFRGVEAKKLPGTYKKFSSLEKLDLNNNIGLKQFPDIYKNKTLKKLTLIGNQVTLENLPDLKSNLEELSLIGNKVSVVPQEIKNFETLKKLNFSNNPITSIDPAIGLLTLLEELSFYNCKLIELPPAMENLKHLKQIDLYFNQLTKLNVKLSSLTNLEVLYLSNNALTALPIDIGSLTKLQELYISNNKISYFPESISELKNLRVLRMNNNYFTTFPFAILTLKNLENLDLSRNDMEQIPDELTTFDNLQIFAMVGNRWENKETVLRIAQTLRAKGTIVHLNTDEEIDSKN